MVKLSKKNKSKNTKKVKIGLHVYLVEIQKIIMLL